MTSIPMAKTANHMALSTTEVSSCISNGVTVAVEKWFEEQCKNPWTKFYLWARKANSDEAVAMPVISPEAPGDEWFLAMTECVSGNWTQEKARYICREKLRTAPILG